MAPKPSGPHLQHRLRTLCLTSPPDTALYYAYLYRAFFPPTDDQHDSLHVFALCLFASGQTYSALQVVRDLADADGDPADDYADSERGIFARGPGCYGCAVIVAKCCNKLERYSEGQAVLDRAIRRSVPMTLPAPNPTDTAATTSLMLATLSHKGKAPAQAVEHYTRALAEDPWLWEAFTGLCDIGAPPSGDSIFPDPPSMLRSSSQRTSRGATLSPGPMPRSSASEVPNFRRQLSPLASAVPPQGLFTPDVGGGLPPAAPARFGMMGNPAVWDTPSTVADTTFPMITEHQSGPSTRRPLPNLISAFLPGGGMLSAALRSTPNPLTDSPPSKPPAMKRPRGANIMRRPAETPVGGPLATESRLNGREHRMLDANGDKDAPVRRSTRLNSAGPKSSKSGASKTSSRTAREKRSTRSHSVTSSTSGHTPEVTSPAAVEAQAQAHVDDWLRDVVRRCARAYRHLSLYQCREALAEIDGLPEEMETSAWSYAIVARAFFELNKYTEAKRAFEALLAAEPYRLEGMDQYSILLWHLGDKPGLSHLSQVLVSVDRDAPQAWVAAGNCFSLQREHDEAMRCFRRATQVSPDLSTAWTLCGHEALAMEEYERAIAFFRTAIRCDARCYTAWYGMGFVYLRQGKLRHAEHHLRRAAEINPSNPALLCCIGTVLEKSDNLPGALAVYEDACQYGGTSGELIMCQYQRSRTLLALGRLDEAIASLEPLARDAPDEANVHFLLGKCYLRAERTAFGIMALTIARELQPKLESAIRATMVAGGLDDSGEELDEL